MLLMYDGSMAVITNMTEVCDVCRNPRRKVQRYRLGQDGKLVAVVLCKEHAAPVELLIDLGTRVPNHSPQVQVWTMDDIEKERKAQNKKTAPLH